MSLKEFSFTNLMELFEKLRKNKEITERKNNEIVQKIKKEKLKIGLINICTLSAKNKNIDKKADIKEIFDNDLDLDIFVCTETNIDD